MISYRDAPDFKVDSESPSSSQLHLRARDGNGTITCCRQRCDQETETPEKQVGIGDLKRNSLASFQEPYGGPTFPILAQLVVGGAHVPPLLHNII